MIFGRLSSLSASCQKTGRIKTPLHLLHFLLDQGTIVHVFCEWLSHTVIVIHPVGPSVPLLFNLLPVQLLFIICLGWYANLCLHNHALGLHTNTGGRKSYCTTSQASSIFHMKITAGKCMAVRSTCICFHISVFWDNIYDKMEQLKAVSFSCLHFIMGFVPNIVTQHRIHVWKRAVTFVTRLFERGQ